MDKSKKKYNNTINRRRLLKFFLYLDKKEIEKEKEIKKIKEEKDV